MNKLKILVIDDDKNINDLLTKLFELNDYLVETAMNGQIGFEKAVKEDFDLVTMDIKMPLWNGLDAIGALEIVKPELKILVISGFLNDHEKQKIKEAPNVLKIILKPFQVNDLLKEINLALKRNTTTS